MEIFALMGVACSAGTAALLLLEGEGLCADLGSRLRIAMPLRLSMALSRMGSSMPVQWLMGFACWDEAAAALMGRADGTGVPLEAPQACACLLAGIGLGGMLATLLFGSVVSGMAVMGCLVALVPLWSARARSARVRELTQEMPSVLRTLSVAMGSGQTLSQAVEYVGSHEHGLAAEAFTRLSLRLRCGVATEPALDLLSRELDAPGVDLLATALVVSHRTGSPLRELLVRSARLVERQGECERLLAVKTAQARLSVRIVCALPVVMVLLLALISPDFQRGLLTPAGLLSVALALALDAVALLIIRKLMREVL